MSQISDSSNQKKSRDSKGFKQAGEEFLNTTTAHGFAHIVSSNYIIETVVWIVIIIISILISIYLIIASFDDFKKFDVIPKEIVHKPIDTIIFPVVTICYSSSENGTIKNQDMKFKYIPLNDTVPYNIGDKICTQINTGKNGLISSDVAGGLLGLEINREYYDLNELSVFVSDQNVSPTYADLNNLIIRKNNHVQISIKKVVSKKLDEPYSQCLKDTKKASFDLEEYMNVIRLNKTYRYENCLEAAYFLKFTEICHCSLIGYRETDGLPDCTRMDKMACFIGSYNAFGGASQFNCPIECDKVYFETRVLSNYVPNPDSSVFSIKVFYQDIEYTEKTEIPKVETFGLLSNFGGIAGLFLGVSFITLFEIVMFLLYLILNFGKYVIRKMK